MTHFTFESAPFAVREDIGEAHREFWRKLSLPGSWWTGAERVAIAEETRNALVCEFCAERKAALSPNSIEGEHYSTTDLPAQAVDAVHRIITDQKRITQSFVDQLAEQGLSNEAYAELVGIVVCTFSIDEFNRGLGLPVEDLPTPQPGKPSHYRPPQAEDSVGFIPMLPREGLTGNEANLWPAGRNANVIRALSLVPQAVIDWNALGGAQYLSVEAMQSMYKQDNRSIDRMQIELIAGRVSAINECFY